MAAKGVFIRDDLDDLDEIMPPSIPRPESQEETEADDTLAGPDPDEVDTASADDQQPTPADSGGLSGVGRPSTCQRLKSRPRSTNTCAS